jgi:hypothetical protein
MSREQLPEVEYGFPQIQIYRDIVYPKTALLDSDDLGQVPGLVDVRALEHGYVVSEQL